MPRRQLSFGTFAPVLAVVFALSAIALVLTSRPVSPPRLTSLTPVEGTLRVRASTLTGTELRIATSTGERIIDAGQCGPATADVRPGDPLTIWTDADGR